MQRHVQLGENICQSHCLTQDVIDIVRYHHERWNGSGYPSGLAGEDIPYLAQVMQILDVYDALTHARSYKPAFSPAQALDILAEETTKGYYQPELMQQFFAFITTESDRTPQSFAELRSLVAVP